MVKNAAGQTVTLYAVDKTTGLPLAAGDLVVPGSMGNVMPGTPASPVTAMRTIVDAVNAAIAAGVALAFAEDMFHVAPTFTVDSEDRQDQYFCGFFKNGIQIEAVSIASPTLTVVKESDGSRVFGPVAITVVSGTNFYQYDQTTAGLRLVAGQQYIATFAATINNVPYMRSFAISRQG